MLPRQSGDALPKTPAGILVAVADRLDSLVGLTAVGAAPSASADPYGLRRAAYGMLEARDHPHRWLSFSMQLRLGTSPLWCRLRELASACHTDFYYIHHLFLETRGLLKSPGRQLKGVGNKCGGHSLGLQA